jgi:hypothetical protein
MDYIDIWIVLGIGTEVNCAYNYANHVILNRALEGGHSPDG